jgi:hypothetical protein
MVEVDDLDGNLTKALLAVRDLRVRCITGGWHPEVLTEALAFAIAIDEHVARSTCQGGIWEAAVRRGKDLAAAIIAEDRGPFSIQFDRTREARTP